MTPDEQSRRLAQRRRRFDRQFEALYRLIPALRRPMGRMQARGWWMVRVPLAIFLIAGAFLAILPVFGLWMLPLGLLLLAVDVTMLQGPLAAAMVRVRHWWRLRRRGGRR